MQAQLHITQRNTPSSSFEDKSLEEKRLDYYSFRDGRKLALHGTLMHNALPPLRALVSLLRVLLLEDSMF